MIYYKFFITVGEGSSEEEIELEPLYWDGVEFGGNRNPWHGFESIRTSGDILLAFSYEHGYSKMVNEYKKHGQEGEIGFRVLWANDRYAEYKELFDGTVNMNDLNFADDLLKCSLANIQYNNKLKTNFKKTVNVYRDTDLDGQPITGFAGGGKRNVTLHSKGIFKRDRLELYSPSWVSLTVNEMEENDTITINGVVFTAKTDPVSQTLQFKEFNQDSFVEVFNKSIANPLKKDYDAAIEERQGGGGVHLFGIIVSAKTQSSAYNLTVTSSNGTALLYTHNSGSSINYFGLDSQSSIRAGGDMIKLPLQLVADDFKYLKEKSLNSSNPEGLFNYDEMVITFGAAGAISTVETNAFWGRYFDAFIPADLFPIGTYTLVWNIANEVPELTSIKLENAPRFTLEVSREQKQPSDPETWYGRTFFYTKDSDGNTSAPPEGTVLRLRYLNERKEQSPDALIVEGGTYNIRLKFTATIPLLTAIPENVFLVFRMFTNFRDDTNYGGTNVQSQDYPVVWQGVYNIGNPIDISADVYIEDVSFQDGQRLHFGFSHYSTNQNFEFSLNVKTFQLDLESITKSTESVTKWVPIYEATDRMINIISGQKDILRSTLMGRADSQPRPYAKPGAASLTMLCQGQAIRGNDNAELSLSLESIINNITKLFPAGYGLKRDGDKYVVEIEDIEHFYKNVELFEVLESEMSDYEMEIEKDIIYNTIDAGFSLTVNEEYSGLDEFNNQRTYSTPIQKKEGVLNLVVNWNASGAAIEQQRRTKYIDGIGKDTKYDDQVFVLAVNESLQPTKNSAFVDIENYIDPDSGYNFEFEPLRTLIRHAKSLFSGMHFKEGTENIEYVSKKSGNSSIITEDNNGLRLSGDGAVTLNEAGFNDRILIPERYTFKYEPIDIIEKFDVISNAPYGYITAPSYLDPGEKIKLHILDWRFLQEEEKYSLICIRRKD